MSTLNVIVPQNNDDLDMLSGGRQTQMLIDQLYEDQIRTSIQETPVYQTLNPFLMQGTGLSSKQ